MRPGLLIDTTAFGVRELRLRGKRGAVRSGRGDEGALARHWKTVVRRKLNAYFSRRLRSFAVPCDLRGLPPFTRAVLKTTAKIPYGEVRSYGWVAERLGRPGAARAVGNALARNPIPIIIPCHRVIRSDRSLGGYALGLNWKRALLGLESYHQRARAKGAQVSRTSKRKGP
jgi:methylated-DNA-[protein]-cysteine S-methyltransferase